MYSAGPEIATNWSPMRLKIEYCRLEFQNWSPAGNLVFHSSTFFLLLRKTDLGYHIKARFLTIDLAKHSSDSLIAMFTERHIVSAVSPNRGTVGALYERWRTYRDPGINVILDKAQYNKAKMKATIKSV